ncbi:MAG: GNAT family N-acetyltransferase, partial [Alphaproteobacteria bacterium]
MPTTDIAYKIDPFPSEEELQPMWQAAWGNPWSGDLAFILTRSLVHACAYSEDRLVGYVNVAWDGGVHAF